jgi:hypothetical protein
MTTSWRDTISDEKLEESFQRAMLAVKTSGHRDSTQKY